ANKEVRSNGELIKDGIQGRVLNRTEAVVAIRNAFWRRFKTICHVYLYCGL
ncbi:unnamed protein product, partial [marine sediment metagenome]